MLKTRTHLNSEFARDVVVALLAPAFALLAAELIHSALGVSRLGLLFLAAVTISASIRGSRAAVLAAFIGVLAYKSFLDLRTNDQTTTIEDMINLLIFLIVALITGTLAGRVHDEAGKAQRNAEQMEHLFNTSRALTDRNGQDFWPIVAGAVARASGGASAILDPQGNLQASSGDAVRVGSAKAVGATLLRSGQRSDSGSENGWRVRAIPAEGPIEGLILWEARNPELGMDGHVEIIADLALAAISRSRMDQEQVRIRATEEAGKLRQALLSSVSHDFRSPLAAIIGSATSLLEYGDRFDDAVRRDLLLNIRDEGEKLNQFVASLLNMTRLQAGAIQPVRRPIKVAQVVTAAAERLARHRGQKQPIFMGADCTVAADPLLFEQIIYNILDNAAKYVGGREPVDVTCVDRGAEREILIADHGPGLSTEECAGVFDSFRFARKEHQNHGSGLGLSICRGFAEAMGGGLELRSRADGESGLEVAIRLPGSSE